MDCSFPSKHHVTIRGDRPDCEHELLNQAPGRKHERCVTYV